MTTINSRRDGRIVSIDSDRNIGLLRDDANEIRDFAPDDMMRWTEFASLHVGDTVSFEPKTRLGRNTAAKVERGAL